VKLAHLADVHLGFRQYHRLTSQGINQREADVAAAFRRAIDDVISASPDAVLIAGDLFNSVRPSNPAILDSFNQLRRLRLALPDAPVVIVAGNHDTPRSVETGTILKLFEAVGGVHVVAEAVQDLVFEELDLCLTCVPHAAWISGPRPTLRPPGRARYQVAITHGEVAGVLPRDAGALEYGGAVLEPGEINAEQWDYVALGHYHVAHRVRENAWYAGALEYVSPNPWGELRDEARAGREGQKGWLLVSLGKRVSVEFRRIALTRRLIDLPPLHASGLTAEDLDQRLRQHVERAPDGIDGQVVRQLVHDVPRSVTRDLDHTAIREYKSRALHYHLDLRRPQPRRAVGVGAPGQRQTLSEVLAEYLGRRPLEAEVDRSRLVTLARTYMDEVERAILEE
jgi:DNA repair exonuclease SbcCD nuclease subunit